MGRADAERDYYGDLELEPTADPNEIKRQFKKLALKYHPDRNPGKEVEYNSKFQAIQSANEVLSDPQQRAKYDAQRMRAGLLHTYASSSSSPTRPSVPTRSPMTDFPPPPRPPPYNAAKNASAPHSSGSQRYKDFRTRPETTTWRGASTDDPKTKTSDFKAWESMRTPRRGEGPIPSQRRTVPPKVARPPPIPPGRETNGKAPKDPSPRRSGWDHLQEARSGVPSTTRADTGRGASQKSGFAPSTPGAGDEPQARSAYFTVGRGERPTNARSQTHMPPPPTPARAPTSKRTDPLATFFKDKVGFNEPFGNKPRASAPYQTGGGEKISPYFTSPGLERSKTSASPRDSDSRTGWYEGKPTNKDHSHHRAASASSTYQKMSPPDKTQTSMPGVSGVYSSSSSSSSSSEEDVDPVSSARPRVTQVPKTRRTRANADQASVQPPGGFNPFAKVGDEPMAPHVDLGAGSYDTRRRHSAVDIDTRNPSEGFSEHRKKHEAEKSQLHSTSVADTSDAQKRAGAQPPLQRSHSWHEKKVPRKDEDSYRGISKQEGNNPMYEPRGYNPFSSPFSPDPPSQDSPSSGKWSDQWPFKSPKKPRVAFAEPPPYWAIPSSLPPPKENVSRKRASTDVPLHGHAHKAAMTHADVDFNSFKISDYARNSFPRTASLRSQSSENINTKFSPDNWHGKFFEPPPLSRSNTPRGASPTKPNIFQRQQEQESQQSSVNGEPLKQDSSKTPTSSFQPPPPPFAQGKFQHEQWAPHLNSLKFDVLQSPQGRSPSRTSTRKRQRTRPPRASTTRASVGDAEDDPTASSATGESLESSKASSDADAMDVDEPTPPSIKTGQQHTNGLYVPSSQPDISNITPRQAPVLPPRSPAVQPQTYDHGQPEKKASHLNLGDLKNTYPFAPSNEGLGNMGEMGATLPHSSHASPIKYPEESSLQRTRFPNPPLCPSNPLNLTQHSWDHYCLNIRRYLDEWTKFNDQMAEILKSITRESLKVDWSDPEGNGYDKHMNMLSEHQRARVHLEVACDNNEKCMKSLGDAMDSKVRGRGGVGRKQSNAGPHLEGLL